MALPRYLICNADDFGVSTGVNHGIIECHRHGLVTSASLMVARPGTAEAVDLAREHPALSVGLHWDGGGEGQPEIDLDDPAAVRDEFQSQLDRFQLLLGRPPTHVDSESHAHRSDALFPLFQELTEPLGVPLRGDGRVRFEGGFYGQWVPGVTDLRHVSVRALRRMLREEVGPGWTEFSCHPGYCTPDHWSPYWSEREAEVRTLTDPRVRAAVDELGICLASYADFLAGGPRA
jgi:predicted glycoside hydrolase/deacetylase ChbG (UPF0249 family)